MQTRQVGWLFLSSFKLFGMGAIDIPPKVHVGRKVHSSLCPKLSNPSGWPLNISRGPYI